MKAVCISHFLETPPLYLNYRLMVQFHLFAHEFSKDNPHRTAAKLLVAKPAPAYYIYFLFSFCSSC